MSDFKIQLDPGAKMPERKDPGAAAYDLYTLEDTIIVPGRNAVPTGVHISFPSSYEAQIEARSGFSLRGMEVYLHKDAQLAQYLDADVITGKIDSSFRGAVKIIVVNHTILNCIIKKHTRLAQLTFVKISTPELELVDRLDDTSRGNHGFGSTGTR